MKIVKTQSKLIIWPAVGLLCVGALGCEADQTAVAVEDYQTVEADPTRDVDRARQLNAEAIKMIEQDDIKGAESLLRDALEADVTYGPAHNNLGKIYYHHAKHYLAAWEFRYAIKLMPQHPEPYNNLGMVFEAAGRLDEAVKHYEEAYEIDSDNPVIRGNLTRARVRRGDSDEQVRDLLWAVLLQDTRPEWNAWAKRQLAAIGDPNQPRP